jgi:hypothetical protein
VGFCLSALSGKSQHLLLIFLSAIAKLRKATRLQENGLSRNWYLIIYRKSAMKIQSLLKSDQDNEYYYMTTYVHLW